MEAGGLIHSAGDLALVVGSAALGAAAGSIIGGPVGVWGGLVFGLHETRIHLEKKDLKEKLKKEKNKT